MECLATTTIQGDGQQQLLRQNDEVGDCNYQRLVVGGNIGQHVQQQ